MALEVVADAAAVREQLAQRDAFAGLGVVKGCVGGVWAGVKRDYRLRGEFREVLGYGRGVVEGEDAA